MHYLGVDEIPGVAPAERPEVAREWEILERESDKSFSWDFVRAVLRSSLHPTAQRIAIGLVSFADPDGGNAFPKLTSSNDEHESVGRLLGGLSGTMCHKWLKVLHEDGWLEVVPFVRSGRRQTSSLYVFAIPDGARRGPKRGSLSWLRRDYGRPAPKDHPAWKGARCSPETREEVLRLETLGVFTGL